METKSDRARSCGCAHEPPFKEGKIHFSGAQQKLLNQMIEDALARQKRMLIAQFEKRLQIELRKLREN
jgi:hypothetical protein